MFAIGIVHWYHDDIARVMSVAAHATGAQQ